MNDDTQQDNVNVDEQTMDQETHAAESPNNSELESLQKENESLKQKVFQLMADFENFRKRTDADKSKYALLGNMLLVSQIAEVSDDIQLSLNDENLDVDHAKQMLQTVQDKLNSTLQSNGLVQISVKKGDKYDSSLMEAITTIPTPNDTEVNTVADVVSAGYRHQQTDEIIKTAKVVVYK